MKSVNEWLEEGYLEGLDESDYHDIVCLYNRILLHAEVIIHNKKRAVEDYIIPLIRRIYGALKTKSQEDPNINLPDLIKHMDAHQILMTLYARSDLFQILHMVFSNIDNMVIEAETLRLISMDLAEGYYTDYKNLKDIHDGVQPDMSSINPTFRLWDKLKGKNKKNEIETTSESPF